MKLFPATVLALLVLLATAPDESGGVNPAWFVAVAAKLGVELIKNAYYARCNTRNVPPGINCPGVVFGMGWTRRQAQSAAGAYARLFGDSQCDRYVGHCQIYKFKKGRGK